MSAPEQLDCTSVLVKCFNYIIGSWQDVQVPKVTQLYLTY